MSAVLGYANQIDNSVLSGGNWNTSYPLTNLQNRYLSKAARSTNVSALSTVISLDLGSTQRIGVVALVSHNMVVDLGMVRIVAYNDSMTTIFDTGFINVYSGSDFSTTFAPVDARYWKIYIDDRYNPAGYVSIGRIFFGWRFKPTNGLDWNASISVESDTQVKRALGGPEYFEERPNRRVWQGRWSWLDDSEAYNTYLAIMRGTDTSREVYFIEDDADIYYRNQRRFLGRFRTLSPIEWPYVSQHAVGAEIGELL